VSAAHDEGARCVTTSALHTPALLHHVDYVGTLRLSLYCWAPLRRVCMGALTASGRTPVHLSDEQCRPRACNTASVRERLLRPQFRVPTDRRPITSVPETGLGLPVAAVTQSMPWRYCFTRTVICHPLGCVPERCAVCDEADSTTSGGWTNAAYQPAGYVTFSWSRTTCPPRHATMRNNIQLCE